MANYARLKTWNANETLTAADLNAEFNNIINNTTSNALDADNLDATDDYLFATVVIGSGLAAGAGDGPVHIYAGSAGTVQAPTAAAELVIEDDDDAGLTILTPDAKSGGIYFGDASDNDVGSIVYDHGTAIIFTAETAEWLRSTGSLNTHAVASQFDSTVTVGVDDTGYDVKFFGATTGKYMLWDESADSLLVVGTDIKLNGTSVAGGVSLTGSTDNTVTTVTGADAIAGEANLTFDGTTLNVVGNAGVGIARTDGTLHVHTATAGTVTAATDADDLVIENSAGVGISLLAPDANVQKITFGCPSDSDYNEITSGYNAGTPYLDLATGSTGGLVTINETANANMTIGITIQQGPADNEIFALKSSDVAHGMTTITETDTYTSFQKESAASGGLRLTGHSATTLAVRIFGDHTTENSNRTTAASAPIEFLTRLKNGTTVAAPSANANMATISANGTVRFIFDSDGDSHQDVGTAWTNFDDEPDALICRSVGIVMDQSSIVKGRFDDWSRDHQADLVRTGLIPQLSQDELDRGERPLMNTTQLARLHNGAIWQLHTEQMELREALDEKDSRIMALEQKMALLQEKN